MVAGAVLGFGILTRRAAYFGQGISQSMLAGVAFGALIGVGVTVSAFAGAVLAAVLITVLGRVRGLGPEAAVAIVASAALSLGVAVVSADRSRAVNLTNVLFGNVLGVTVDELVVLGFAVVAAVLFSVLNGRRLALSAAAPQVALAHGVAVNRIEFARTLVLALVTAASVQVVGITLVVAALVLPAAAAAVLTRSLGGFHLVAVVAAAVTAVVGLYVSYWVNIPSGPAVVLSGTGLYIIAILVAALRRG